jgi:hypothetical protein
MLFLPFQNAAMMHQIVPNRMRIFKTLPGGKTPDPQRLDPREEERKGGEMEREMEREVDGKGAIWEGTQGESYAEGEP